MTTQQQHNNPKKINDQSQKSDMSSKLQDECEEDEDEEEWEEEE